MNQCKASFFWENWRHVLSWEQDSGIAVLFRDRRDWEELPAHFREELQWNYQVVFFELPRLEQLFDEADAGQVRDYETAEALAKWRSGQWMVVGDFSFQQHVRALGERENWRQQSCVRVLLGEDFQMAGREEVWLRDRQGNTCYRKRLPLQTADWWVILHRRDPWERELYAWKEKLFGEGRDVCEELAEPLRILYGIPIVVGTYFALLSVFWHRAEHDAGGEAWERAARELIQLAGKRRRTEQEGILLPTKNLPLLIRMAAEGCERLPEEQHGGREQIELFYRMFLL